MRRVFVDQIMIVLAVCGVLQSVATAQSELPAFQGAASCTNCHEDPSSVNIEDGATNRICFHESQIWAKADRHASATEVLKGERGRRIASLMGIDQVFDPRHGCIQCHTTTTDANQIAANPTKVLTEGVGCEACHGPSSQWETKHNKFPAWHESNYADRANLGWIEIKSPIVRAEVCASCHVGDAKQNRLITHDMYAAGHPPLSGFEIESFADNMPRHWMYSHERASPEPSFDRTKNILVGSVVALRKSVELAMADATAPSESKRWPELARLDCFACHHELTSQNWRQSPVSLTAPGRPQLAAGCLPLVVVAAQVAGVEQDSVDAIAAKLQEPFAKNIFGDPQQLAQSGGEVVAWCKAVENSLAGRKFQSEDARTVLRAIAEQAESKPCDYDTARQLFGAWQVVFDEYVAERPTEFTAVRQRLEQMSVSHQFALQRDPRKSPCDPPPVTDPAAKSQEYANLLNELFHARVGYDPAAFQRDMAELNNLTGE